MKILYAGKWIANLSSENKTDLILDRLKIPFTAENFTDEDHLY